MSARSLFRGTVWGLIGLIFVFHVVGGWHYSNRIIEDGFVPSPGAVTVSEGDFELVEVTYTSSLGEMDAWYIPAPGTTWVIHIHGLNATPAEPEILFQPLFDANHPQLAITYRNDEGQPADPSGYHQYGTTEWEDMAAAVEFARENGAATVVLAGYSTGASHAFAYVLRHHYDYIGGVITDSANIDLGQTLDFRGAQESLPVLPMNVPRTMSWVAKFFTSLRIDVNWKSLDYIARAERSLRVPILAIHGTADDSVPITQSIELRDVRPELVELLPIEGAGHIESFEVDYDRYVDGVLSFLERVGSPA
jgi:uncharacterized protein